MEHFVWINLLYDFYGQMLTEKQRQAVEWYYGHDLSLSEIADELQVSRQAVHDLLRRSQQALEGFEQKLGLVQRFQGQQQRIDNLSELLHELNDPTDPRWQRVFQLLADITK